MQGNNNMMNQDMQRMQQEAIRRVQEMQSRAKANLQTNTLQDKNNRENNQSNPNPQEKVEKNESKNDIDRNDNKTKHIKKEPIANIFDSLMQDSERTLIIILILILVSENADISIILALMYLII